MSVPFSLSAEEQRYLGHVAQCSIAGGLAGKQEQEIPEPPTDVVRQHLGSFVTLTLQGHLRGCIGTIVGREPLFSNVARMARAAAFGDSRFPPLTAQEWERVELEISVLGPLTPCPDPQAVEVGRHGLVLQMGGQSGVFLPKVPVEQGWDLPAYLENLCRKAGLPGGSWKHPAARLFWYEAFAFPVVKQD